MKPRLNFGIPSGKSRELRESITWSPAEVRLQVRRDLFCESFFIGHFVRPSMPRNTNAPLRGVQ